ncbi:glycosyltransferase family 4 protein [Staphylococcus saprophyticus]|uniref:glycosyltransferase family 4 protein n=1 Tax=Staphylococcus saprophyticus TaxID=29385 RepID=UPI000FF89161|nr:glycosyltransferase family 4 protein [Staphylococcus saprophyticus]MDW4099699.1 glycosyltransferase family 4 protein [Staphylococcus saprophyticus]MDW4158949.1 glycosyltransferase family 4 protein [Staphylococcus saprophyticus]MDW4161878.1 glycosyltransferase family 4 protein [Staphylococcus saprophyticus]MDW4423658.1 glycosyltransferase family 4 protein [Staphylococcus saprophyticus]MDW4433154.1 glycosyltransferase family 4 protein [Staphylococcus saprophyticus]
MKNILVVSQYYNPEPFLINEIVDELNEKNYKLTILTGMPNYPEGKKYNGYMPGIVKSNNKKIIRVNERPRKKGKINLFLNYASFAFRGSIKVLKMKNEFDVIYVYQLSPVFMVIPALIYKWKFKKKILLYCLDLWPQSLVSGGIKTNSIIYKIFLSISRIIYNNVDKIQISSNLFEKYFNEELLINKKLKYVPQYANDLFVHQNNNHSVDFEFNNRDTNLLFAGNLGEMQSIDTLIKAIKLCDDQTIKLHIVGDGSNKASLKNLTNNLDLNDSVIFHGRKPINAMPSYYKKADALLVSLKKDEVISYTLPGKVQTYMASGKPLIASIDGETANVINKSNCGLVSPAEDITALSYNINAFRKLNDKQKGQLGKNGKKYYENHFTKNIFINSLTNDLEELSK